MDAILVSALVVGLLYASAWLGHGIMRKLPETHRSSQTLKFAELTSGLLITFMALILSLLINSVYEDFKNAGRDVGLYASTIIRLDAELSALQPHAHAIREALRRYTAAAVATTWPEEAAPSGDYPKATADAPEIDSNILGDLLHTIEADIRLVAPDTDAEGLAKTECLKRMEALLDERWELISEAHSTISPPLVIVMLFWLSIVFISFGLLAPPNMVSVAFVMIVGLSIGGAIFVILELQGPLDGWIKVSSEPLRHALRHLDLSLRANG